MAGSPTTAPMELGVTGPPTLEIEESDIKFEASVPREVGAGAGVEENVKVSTKAVEKRVTKNTEEKSSSPIDGDDDEGDLCRICRTSGEEGSPLYYPCACSGSIKYVHQECLLQWLSHSNARHCEVLHCLNMQMFCSNHVINMYALFVDRGKYGTAHTIRATPMVIGK